MAVVLVFTTCYLAIVWALKSTEFIPLVMLALTFFYKQRADEDKTEAMKTSENQESKQIAETSALPTDDILLSNDYLQFNKSEAHDTTNQQ